MGYFIPDSDAKSNAIRKLRLLQLFRLFELLSLRRVRKAFRLLWRVVRDKGDDIIASMLIMLVTVVFAAA